ncbi:gephyrin-like molybdotransferase Glp [Paenibacillus sp.]|jgi:molybdopterin molybdotransferase|uniref:molybdopterin molybdotransferase MoeA n=1 Tax=Paenibacillus sp. TaxID=58172 RepID=UPI00283266C1|nr:gephyrin-like molybdotransferase Glp [Paenibacillus sp.]MDR0267584.1 molybdopterin molybdotransferase MoeA [Paenibacillus sp.]
MKLNNNDKFNRKPLQVSEAQELLSAYGQSGPIEQIPLPESYGRYLAEEIKAPHPFPRFRRSGMDGYAIRSEDTAGCSSEHMVWLDVIDEIPCGSVSDKQIMAGTAARIMTGAQVPEGADAVVMLEMTELRDYEGRVQVGLKRKIEAGKNITPIGFEVEEEEILLRPGRRIQAGEISVLASFGIHQVTVYQKPRIAIFSTGSELLTVDEPLQPGKIRNSNTYMLATQVSEAGGEPYILEAVMDDLSLAKAKVEKALREYDAVVTSGGVSVGDYDIMGDFVRSGSVDMLYNKIAMRPGSVTTAAVKDGKLLFALSGNPGACFVGFELFVRPFIQRTLGSGKPYLTEWTAVLDQDYTKVNAFTRYVRGRVEVRDGILYAIPAKVDESSVMVTIKDSDCLIVIPPAKDVTPAGGKVKILLLKGNTL